MIVCMAQVDRFSVTMPPDPGEGIGQAAADKLRNELLAAALDEWEAEAGPFTRDELDQAASSLALAPHSDVA
jgi:hypothetical protein